MKYVVYNIELDQFLMYFVIETRTSVTLGWDNTLSGGADTSSVNFLLSEDEVTWLLGGCEEIYAPTVTKGSEFLTFCNLLGVEPSTILFVPITGGIPDFSTSINWANG